MEVFLQNLIVAQLVKNLPAFLDPENTSLFSQELVDGFCPESDESSSHPPILFQL
jgi:hypothetical protein